jgi:peptide/nickel transport system substrate-binding protein
VGIVGAGEGAGLAARGTGMSAQRNSRQGRHRVVTLTITVIVLLALAAVCAGLAWASASPSPAASGDKVTLRLGWSESPLNLNPFIGYSNSYEIWLLNYDTLVAVGADGLPSKETGLAEDWTLSADQKEWTFKIRPGVKWQDGEPLTARDVAWTFNTIIENELSLAIYLKDVEKAVAVDDTTLKVTCTAPKANMLLTQVYIYILPEHIWGDLSVDELSNTFRNPVPIVGSGPFQTVEFEKDDYVKLVRNPGYWGEQPTIDEVIFQYYTNSDTMVQDLKSGAVDGAQVVPATQFKQLQSEPGIKAIPYPLYNWEYVDINCYDSPDSLGNPVLVDPAFRVAMAWAIDREKCASLAWNGLADPGYGIFPEKGWPAAANPYYQPDAADTIGFDLEKSRQLMDDAGYVDSDGDGIREDKKGEPIKLRLWARDISPESQVQGKLIAGWLQEIGLDVDYSVVDEGALGDSIWNYKGDTYAPDYDLALWDFMGYIDPGDSAACFTTDQIENYNEMNWSNAEYDRLTEEQYREMDTAARMELLKQGQAVMYAEQPMIVIDYPSVLQAVNVEKWEGWQPYVGGSVWNNFLDRQSYIELKPKVAEAGTAASEGSSTTLWVVAGAVIAVALVVILVVLIRRNRGRAVEE